MNAPAGIGISGPGPTQDSERIDSVDVLRGFALLGILVVNIGYFAFPVSEPFYLSPAAGALDRAVHWWVTVLAQGKFYPLFSLLFGLGFAMQLRRLQERGKTAGLIYVRRLVVLLVIGLLHGVFIWAGDILVAYAVLGFALLAFAHASPRSLLLGAVIALVLQAVMLIGLAAALDIILSNPADESLVELTASMDEAAALRADAWNVYAAGSFLEITRVRVREFSMVLESLAFFSPQIFGMFLLGAWFGSRQVLSHPLRHRRLLKTLLVTGLVAGLPLSIRYAQLNETIDYHALPSSTMSIAMLVNSVAGVLMALAYLAAITLATQTRATRMLRFMSPVGRMALSNYLLQSVICTLFFYSYGLGYFAQLGKVGSMIIVAVIFVLQLIASNWWLMRFRFGPAEWLWRSATYGEWQAFRRNAVEFS